MNDKEILEKRIEKGKKEIADMKDKIVERTREISKLQKLIEEDMNYLEIAEEMVAKTEKELVELKNNEENLTEVEKTIFDYIVDVCDDLGEEDEFIYNCLEEDGFGIYDIKGIVKELERKGYIFFDEDSERKYIYINHKVEL